MRFSLPQSFELICHPATPCAVEADVEVEVGIAADGGIALLFSLAGELDRLRLPAGRPSRRANDLWKHSCFEAFIAIGDEASYDEFNYAPSGEWANYPFSAYREATTQPPIPAPEIQVRRMGNRLELETTLRLGLPVGVRAPRLRLGLSAVLEDQHGELSCWALKHPSAKPDFHHPESFALRLDGLDGTLET